MIVPVKLADATVLTKIALKSKAHWDYSKAQIENWRDDLTVTSEYLQKTSSFVYKKENAIVGFYILEKVNMSKVSLEFLFVLPEFIGLRIGFQLLQHAIVNGRSQEANVLSVLSDPNAEKFYAKQGFEKKGMKESAVPGRFLPEMELKLEEN